MTITETGLPGALDAGIITCRNMMSGPTVIAADAKRNYEVIFAGKGDVNGEDVQMVTEAMVRTPQFAKAIAQGILEVVDGRDHPVVVQAMSRQSDSFRKRVAAEELSARETLDAISDNDIVVVNCIGPGTREGAVCGDQVPVKDKDQASRPPLCDRHRPLSDRCVKRGDGPWILED